MRRKMQNQPLPSRRSTRKTFHNELYSRNILRKLTPRSRVISECDMALQSLCHNCNIKVKWTKEHGKCPCKIKTDSLDKDGTKMKIDDDKMRICQGPIAVHSCPWQASVNNRCQINLRK